MSGGPRPVLEPINPGELDDGSGVCIHDRLRTVRDAVGTFMQARPANTTQRVDVQLRAYLEGIAGRSLTVEQVQKLVKAWADSL